MPLRSEPQQALGRAIKAARANQGLTQEQLAHAADVHPTWISRIESGQRNPAWGTVARIAEALGMTVSQLAAQAEALNND